MEQVTRDEMIGLLSRVDKAMSHPYHDENTIQDVRRAIAALQAAEPVGWVWDFLGKTSFTAEAYHKEVLEDEGLTLEPVFTLPCPPATADGETVYKCAFCKHVYIEPVSQCDCLEHGVAQQWERWVISPESCPPAASCQLYGHEVEGCGECSPPAKACDHCNSTGEMETDNNGPIVPCPLCQPAKAQVPEDPFKAEKLFLEYANQRLLKEGSSEYTAALSAFTTAYRLAASPAPEHSEQDLESLMSQHRIGLIPINTTDWKAFVYDETIGQDHTCIASSPKAALTALFASLGPIQQEEVEPVVQHRYPCGCVTCICEDDEQCQGCGATICDDYRGPSCGCTHQQEEAER